MNIYPSARFTPPEDENKPILRHYRGMNPCQVWQFLHLFSLWTFKGYRQTPYPLPDSVPCGGIGSSDRAGGLPLSPPSTLNVYGLDITTVQTILRVGGRVDKVKINEVLQELRKKEGMSYGNLADALGISRGLTQYRLMQGNMKIRTAVEMLSAFEYDLVAIPSGAKKPKGSFVIEAEEEE